MKDNNNEVVITVEEEDPKEAFNYVAYPIRQVSSESEYEYAARLIIMNISRSERNFQHFLEVKTRFLIKRFRRIFKNFIQTETQLSGSGDEASI